MNQSQFGSHVRGVRERLANELIPATPVPFDSNGRLHERGHDSYLRYMTGQPIAGVAVWAHTGRGLMLDGQTAHRVLRDFREALPQTVIIAGVGSRDPDLQHAKAGTLEMA